jgi:hypothetical protein
MPGREGGNVFNNNRPPLTTTLKNDCVQSNKIWNILSNGKKNFFLSSDSERNEECAFLLDLQFNFFGLILKSSKGISQTSVTIITK